MVGNKLLFFSRNYGKKVQAIKKELDRWEQRSAKRFRFRRSWYKVNVDHQVPAENQPENSKPKISPMICHQIAPVGVKDPKDLSSEAR